MNLSCNNLSGIEKKKKKERNVNGNECILGKVINAILDLNLLFIYQIIMKQPQYELDHLFIFNKKND